MSASLSVRRLVSLLAAWLLPATLPGQTVTSRAVIAAPKSSVSLPGQTERGDGLWAGLALDVQAGRFAFSASGTRGRLAPSQVGSAPERDVGELSMSGRYEVLPWLGFAARYTARAFSSAAGYQRWDIVSVGAAASRELGTPVVRAFASLEYLPVVTLSTQAQPDFAFASDVGIALAPDGFPLACVLSYRVERFRFPAAAQRSEQFETLTLSAGVRVRRLGGRWTLGGGGK